MRTVDVPFALFDPLNISYRIRLLIWISIRTKTETVHNVSAHYQAQWEASSTWTASVTWYVFYKLLSAKISQTFVSF